MTVDEYGQVYLSQQDVLNNLYADPSYDIGTTFVYEDEEIKKHSQYCKHFDIAKLTTPSMPDMDPIKYHKLLSSDWQMPDEYKNLDVHYICRNKLETLGLVDARYEAILEDELHEFAKRDMMHILRFMCYMVKVVNENDIVTGVGRGSSVSSLVLYLIGVHHIDPIKYNLSYKEFLR